MTPRILIIAGSDSGGGAGIQADIKTVTMLGGHAMTAITAITAQNTLGVQGVLPISADWVAAQMASAIDDIGVDAIKIGMLPSEEVVRMVAGVLVASHRVRAAAAAVRGPGSVPIVLDPVLVATSGDALAGESVAREIAARLVPLAAVVTPNVNEAKVMLNMPGFTGRNVPILFKGGDAGGESVTDTLIDNDGRETEWTSPRIATTSTHGTGCTLATAIATYLAYGYPLIGAIHRAREFVRLALHEAPGLGEGHGPMGHQQVRLDAGPGARLNQITLPQAPGSADFWRLIGVQQIVATDDRHYARFEAAGGVTLSVEDGAAPTVFIECDELDAEVKRLRSAGIAVTDPVDRPWGWREARLTDPAGNAVCLYRADENRRFPPWRLR